MSVTPCQDILYSRNFANDAPPQTDMMKRVGMAAMPFISLIAPIPVSIAMGTLRVYNSQDQDVIGKVMAMVALAGAFFKHKVGTVITTAHDTLIEIHKLSKAEDWEEASKSLFKILHNLIELSLISRGGLELSLIVFAMKTVISLLDSREEFKNGRWIEGVSNLLMAGVRLQGTRTQYNQIVQTKQVKIMEASFKEMSEDLDKTQIGRKTIKTPNEMQIHDTPSLHAAIEKNDLAAVHQILELSPDQIHVKLPGYEVGTYRSSRRAGWHGWVPSLYEEGMTPFQLSLSKGHIDIAILLLKKGANPHETFRSFHGTIFDENKKDMHGKSVFKDSPNHYTDYSPIYWAIISKDERIVQMLLDKNVQLKKASKSVTVGSAVSYLEKSALDVSLEYGTKRISEMIISKQYKPSI